MDRSFDFLTPKGEIGAPKKSTVGGFIGNMGIIIAALTLLCTCVMFFTDVSLSSVVTVEFSLSFLILLFCSYTMYFSMADTGARRGAQDEEYIQARARYDELRKRLGDDGMLFSLDVFCHRYTERELISAQRAILLGAGISYDEFKEKYKGKRRRETVAALGGKRARIVAKANALKPITLTPDMLLSIGRRAHARNPLREAPDRKRLWHTLCALVPTTLTSFFAVSVVCSVISEPSLATVTECIIKLFALVWNGSKGYVMGYNNIAKETVEYLSDRCDILCAALHENTDGNANESGYVS